MPRNLELNGKIVLVTGGASGIGRATALAFGAQGSKVIVADVMAADGAATAQAICDADGEAHFIQVDVSKADQVQAMIAEIVALYGRLDCTFNNAGVEGVTAFTDECTEENWDRVMGINLKGTWLCMKYELLQMRQQRYGSIVNTCSISGFIAFRGSPAYVASKHGISGLTKTAALEYAKEGIRVNAVCPGVIHSPMIERYTQGDPAAAADMIALEPIGRMGRPEEVAEAVLWLSSEAASFVTGSMLSVDGGFLSQ